jgi:hypothetical protein
MKAHTPGPWAAEYVGDSGGENPVEVWEVVSYPGFLRVAEHMSAKDARLIAAAPDLLETCMQIVSRGIADAGTINKCRAAIAKATGAL